MTAEQNFVGISKFPATDLQIRALNVKPVGSQGNKVLRLGVGHAGSHVAVCLGCAFVLIGGAVGILVMEFQAAEGRRAVVDHVVMTSRGKRADKLPAPSHIAPAGAERINSAVEKTGCSGARQHGRHAAHL